MTAADRLLQRAMEQASDRPQLDRKMVAKLHGMLAAAAAEGRAAAAADEVIDALARLRQVHGAARLVELSAQVAAALEATVAAVRRNATTGTSFTREATNPWQRFCGG